MHQSFVNYSASGVYPNAFTLESGGACLRPRKAVNIMASSLIIERVMSGDG